MKRIDFTKENEFVNRELQLHQQPYIYKTGDINESIALVNRLFWEDIIRDRRKYLKDFCFRFGIDASVKPHLEKIERKDFKLLCSPVIMDFIMEFSKPVKELVKDIRDSQMFNSDSKNKTVIEGADPSGADFSGMYLNDSLTFDG